MKPRRSIRSQKGTVILVTLCFVAVIGIVLASYITVCSRAMTLSGRSVQSGLSKQLAELGLEEALRAFNGNYLSGTSTSAGLADWSANGITVDWTLDTTNKRATANVTFSSPSSKFGTSVKNASVKIRVDNYDDAQLPSTWNGTTANYRIEDLVGYNGTWYRAVQNHSNQTPSGIANLAYWAPEGISWKWSNTISYRVEDVINYNGIWYRCIQAHSGHAPPNVTYWTVIPAIKQNDTTGVYLVPEAVVNWFGTWYRWNVGGYWDSSPPIFWRWRSGYGYASNDIVCYSNVWYRCILAHTSSASIYPTNTTYWENVLSGPMWAWNSNYNYNVGAAVYHSGTSSWYRCVVANSNQTPSSTSAYWSTSPKLSNAWDASRQYSANDTVFYNGTWYLSYVDNNSSHIPPTSATSDSYWYSTDYTARQWNSATPYSAGTYRSYGGVWYKCLVGNTGQSPNNTTYWTASWPNSSGVTTGASVAYAESTVTLGDGSTTKTQLRATLAPAPLFPNAVGSATTITINGGGTIDSYDSISDPTAIIKGSSAVLAAGSSLTISGTPAISGYLTWPSPPSGINNNTTINGVPYSDDKSRVSRSPYVPVFSPQPSPSLSSAFSSWNFPYGTVLPTNNNGIVTIGTPGAVTPARYYWNGTLDIASSAYDSSNECTTLNVVGPVILYINGGLRVRGGGGIVVKETGSAEIHADGSIRTESTSNGIDNQTLDPKKLALISDVSSTSSQYYASSTPLYGVIYAPNTTASLGFEIRNSAHIYGAISAKKVTFTADANVHYDTSLRYATIPGVDQPYAIAQWRELTDATELATMP
ncbi:MAG: hypothetical protein HYV95_04820 [Opitutae bacterium]|nr:hypothetical protein [Opitutae bacterium]